MISQKTNQGRFLEDFEVGQIIEHATPRTVTDGERALTNALYPIRHSLFSSDEFARNCGLERSPLNEMAAFHIVFGKTVPDISLNAVANLGYAEWFFHEPVHAGDTIRAITEIIGIKQNSNGRTGIVWVRSRGLNQQGAIVIEFVRWVMVRKRDPESPAPETCIPDPQPVVEPGMLPAPSGLDFTGYDFTRSGEPHRWGDYQAGEIIDHVDGTTIEETEHMLATRLWQNTARVHFDATSRQDGRRLIYGGHVISLARALSFNGLANAQLVLAVNSGNHVNPCFAGDTVHARSIILEKAGTRVPGAGALRIRTLAARRGNSPSEDFRKDSKDLDYWALAPL